MMTLVKMIIMMMTMVVAVAMLHDRAMLSTLDVTIMLMVAMTTRMIAMIRTGS